MPTKSERSALTPKQRKAIAAIPREPGRRPRSTPRKRPTKATAQVVARAGNRMFVAPERCSLTWVEPGFEVNVDVHVIEGRACFRRIELVCFDPMEPLEVQRMPWGRIAEGAVENSARDELGERSPRDVWTARKRDRKAASRQRVASDEPRQRLKVDDDVLRQVVRLRQEARNRGERSWAAYAAAKMNYQPGYVRQLAMRADREL